MHSNVNWATQKTQYLFYMVEKVQLRYLNQDLNIGLVSVKQAYFLLPEPTLLLTEVYRGKLVYRLKGSSKRFSYDQVKKALKKTTMTLHFNLPDWLIDTTTNNSRKEEGCH